MVEIVNDRPVYKVSFSYSTCNCSSKTFATFEFQRDGKDKNGDEIYLWYNEQWILTKGSNFQARNKICFMYNNSKSNQEL